MPRRRLPARPSSPNATARSRCSLRWAPNQPSRESALPPEAAPFYGADSCPSWGRCRAGPSRRADDGGRLAAPGRVPRAARRFRSDARTTPGLRRRAGGRLHPPSVATPPGEHYNLAHGPPRRLRSLPAMRRADGAAGSRPRGSVAAAAVLGMPGLQSALLDHLPPGEAGEAGETGPQGAGPCRIVSRRRMRRARAARAPVRQRRFPGGGRPQNGLRLTSTDKRN